MIQSPIDDLKESIELGYAGLAYWKAFYLARMTFNEHPELREI